MNIAIVGCGFVFDIYMRTIKAHPEIKIIGVYDINPSRLKQVVDYYGFFAYRSMGDLLADKSVQIVVNLTNIGSHYEISKASLLAGKHVFSEKPITKSLLQTSELFELAKKNNVRLSAAPSNIYSDTVRTIAEAIREKAIGKPLLVYAELDDNPIHLMEFENVKSQTGAVWPLEEEIEEGCTFEHVGYHLVWICGILGPAISVTAFSSELIEKKSVKFNTFSGTPDYSVACLHFANGATARITCSVVAPRNHRMRIIGEHGELSAEGYRQYQSPVSLEEYRKGNLTARKFRTIENSKFLSLLFGIGGRKLKLIHHSKSHAVEGDNQSKSSIKNKMVEFIRRKEVYAQDKFIGIAEFAREISLNEPQYLNSDFLTHVNELTLLIQGAGVNGIAVKPITTFKEIGKIPGSIDSNLNVDRAKKKGVLEFIFS